MLSAIHQQTAQTLYTRGLRFGRRAKPAEMPEIKTAAAQAGWDTKALDHRLTFVQEESRIPLWRNLQQLWNRVTDGLRLRWTLYRKGIGLFPKIIPSLTEIYTIRKYPSTDRTQAQFQQLQTISEKLIDIKRRMIQKAETERQYREVMNKNLSGIDHTQLGVPQSWLNPFSLLKPITLPRNVKTDIKTPLGPEHFLPTTGVLKLNDTTLLLRTRLGPHLLEG